jgi:hypothetical protein
MTNEEAVKELNGRTRTQIATLLGEREWFRFRDALDYATRVLKTVEKKDLISREDMLDAIGHGTTYTSEELQEIIKGLSSV